MDIIKEREVQVFNRGNISSGKDFLVVEESLQIVLNGIDLVNIACSPENTTQLAIGYLLSEGYIKKPGDITNLNAENPLCIKVETEKNIDISSDTTRVNTCMGKGRSNLPLPLPYDGVSLRFSPEHLLKIINHLDSTSVTFHRTGGVHSAGLADNHQMLFRCEDIGRHNAVDKVIGEAFLKQVGLNDKCLLLSGRIASEILIKTARNGIPVILSRSAPTLLAVELAEQLGLTVVGFARGERFNIYCNSERILFD